MTVPPGNHAQDVLLRAVERHRAGAVAEAASLYGRVLALAPGHGDALHLSGVAETALGRWPRAVRRLQAALILDPDFAEAWSSFGTLFTAMGQPEVAVLCHARALSVAPALPAALAGLAAAARALAVVRHGAGAVDGAAAALAVALAVDPADAVAWNNVGGLGEDDAPFRRAALSRPDYARAHLNRGRAAARGKWLEQAVSLLMRAVALEPEGAEAYGPLALALRDGDRLDAAERVLRHLCRLAPEDAAAWVDRGTLEQMRGRAGAAGRLMRAGLAYDPACTDGLSGLGLLCCAAGDEGEGERWLERALTLAPELADARLNRGLLRLGRGCLAAGWRDYGWRFRAKGQGQRHPVGAVPWNGRPLSGRTLLVWREQGLGDEILFSSLYGALERLGGPVVVEADARLAPLLARSFPALTVRADSTDAQGGETLARAGAHVHVAAGSLPLVLRPRLDAFPMVGGWLVADPVRRERWRGRLAALGPGLRVGICWRSSLMTTERRHAYTRLEDWGPVLSLPGIRFVNLQYDDCAAEIAAAEARFAVRIDRWADLDLRNDLEEAAALVAELDLVISPATVAGELAGALGVPVWRLGHPDWTRLGSGVRPWFPGMRLWPPGRGRVPGAVLPRLAVELAALVPSRPVDDGAWRDDLARAVTLYRGGRLDEAEKLCRAILAAGRGRGEAHQLLAVLLRRRGDHAAAAEQFTAATRADAGNAAAWAGLAGALDGLNRAEAAERAQRAALTADPALASSWLNLSVRLVRRGGRGAGTAALRAVRLSPGLTAAWVQAGNALAPLRADAALRRALALDPASADALSNLGTRLRNDGDVTAAQAALSRAVAVQPGMAAAWTNLGTVWGSLGRADRAAECHRRALDLSPGLAEAQANLGLMLQREGRVDEAAAAFAAAVAAAPDFAQAHHNRALLLLEHGALRQGWQEHEWRFATPQFAGQQRRLSARPWRGENIAGKRILVWGEQGIGDEILFSAAIPDLMARAGHVVVECEPRLVPLFARSFPGATVRPAGGGARDVDVQSAAGSLPRFLRPALARFPARAGWLVADTARARAMGAWLDGLGPGLAVGLSWRSAAMEGERRWSYVSLAALAPLFAVPGVVFVSVQYGDTADEIAEVRRRFGVTIHQAPGLDLKNDIDGAAALTAGLDLVIAPAVSGAELAGALGVPVWRFGRSDWTQLGSGVRPWYPSMRLFQPARGADMASTAAPMAAALRQLAEPPEEDADTLLERAAALHQAGDRAGAAPLYAHVLRRRPGDPVALHLSGLLALQEGDAVAALPAIAAALRLDPGYGAAWASLGGARLAAGDAAGAAAAFGAALALRPADPAVLTNRGNALLSARRAGEAVSAHRRALVLAPGLVAARDNLGCALLAAGDGEGAERAHARAVADAPDFAAAHANRAIALRRLGRVPAAVDSLHRAVALDPAQSDAAATAGRLLREVGDDPAAERWCARALALDPGHGGAAFNAALLRLARGDLAGGWPGYDARWADPEAAGHARRFSIPPWTGEDPAGRRILVWEEQGVGDSLLFLSCLPDLAAVAGGVVVECEERLVPLLARSCPGVTVRTPTADPRDADWHVPAGSLARWLRPSLARFPGRAGWLAPDPGRAALWRRRVAALGPGLAVGVGWRSGVMTAERRGNYLPLAALVPLLSLPGVVPVSIQYGDTEAEIADVERRFGLIIHRWPDLDLKNDLDGAAALTAALDLVVSPAMSAGELAGALGVPVWRFGRRGDWTRLGTGARPWFPSMHLFTTPPGQGLYAVPPAMVAALRRMAGP
ncbi:tetratricopeptide (TPR) repeat protein/ADP-heptose:LPS heptosyltransferase [Azospirillum fermentarium]|uniref:tetratricopeptide repeat protein n=1 Tax=Azospirillum fermentarium TaxID=1233114 RepID=UPI00222707D4|nr:tetratricopeptide repeat protein [Azospirillum fermentarium]MCW2247890.1 tetratricopeptide (TPR) repeat protein/ADP-heptose:LPS heptosyltransferase [Azospirillum fermentarium]